MSLWKKLSKKLSEKKQKKKKQGASEFIAQFDEKKEEISKELEENKGELQEKIVHLYKLSETRVQILLKEPDDSTIEKHALDALNLVQDLAKAGFPGASILSESLARYGALTLPGPTTYLLLKASGFVKDEPAPVLEIPVEDAAAVQKEKLPAEAKPFAKEKEAAKLAETENPSVKEKEAAAKADIPAEAFNETTVPVPQNESSVRDEAPKEEKLAAPSSVLLDKS